MRPVPDTVPCPIVLHLRNRLFIFDTVFLSSSKGYITPGYINMSYMTDHLQIIHTWCNGLDISGQIDLYDLYDLYNLAHVAWWKMHTA